MTINLSQVAKSESFDPTAVIIAEDTQAAIEEAKREGLLVLELGFSGNGSNGRWLEWPSAAPSNTSPFVAPYKMKIRGLALSGGSSAFTVGVFSNPNVTPVQIASLAVTGIGYSSNLSVIINAGTLIGAKQTAGSSSKPVMFIFCEILEA